MFDENLRIESNKSLAPHMENYLDRKFNQDNDTPEVQRTISILHKVKDDNEYPDFTDETALTNHQERIKRISGHFKGDSKRSKRRKPSKKSRIGSSSRLSLRSKRSRSGTSTRRKSCCLNLPSTSLSTRRKSKKSLKNSLPSGKPVGKPSNKPSKTLKNK